MCRYGTALGVIRYLHETSNLEHAFCTETRPYNQVCRWRVERGAWRVEGGGWRVKGVGCGVRVEGEGRRVYGVGCRV